jgi:hypothetical protein
MTVAHSTTNAYLPVISIRMIPEQPILFGNEPLSIKPGIAAHSDPGLSTPFLYLQMLKALPYFRPSAGLLIKINILINLA